MHPVYEESYPREIIQDFFQEVLDDICSAIVYSFLLISCDEEISFSFQFVAHDFV